MGTPNTTTYNLDIGDDRHIVVEECGVGRPVIFIHGVLMSRQFFKHQINAIGEEARFISFDLPGHGDSSDAPFGHTVTEYAEVLAKLIQSTGEDNVVLVAWSMGAFISWEYLKNHNDDLVSAVVVVEELATDFKRDDYPYAAIDMPFLMHLMETWATKPEQIADLFIGAMFMEEQSDINKTWLRNEILKTNSSNGCSILFDQTVRDYREDIDTFNIPSLLIFGEDEKLISVEAAKDLHKRISNSRLELFPKSGHCPFLEEPEKFNRSIKTFLDELD